MYECIIVLLPSSKSVKDLERRKLDASNFSASVEGAMGYYHGDTLIWKEFPFVHASGIMYTDLMSEGARDLSKVELLYCENSVTFYAHGTGFESTEEEILRQKSIHFDEMLLDIIGDQEYWAVWFSKHCDELDEVVYVTAEECVNLFNENIRYPEFKYASFLACSKSLRQYADQPEDV